MDLPHEMVTDFGMRRLSVYYSRNKIGEVLHWRKFQRTDCRSSGEVWFIDEDGEPSNSVVVHVKNLTIDLLVRHFCTFAIVVDARRSDKKAFINAFMKTHTNYKSLIVDMLILVGCDEKAMVSIHGDNRLNFLSNPCAFCNACSWFESSGCNCFLSEFLTWWYLQFR